MVQRDSKSSDKKRRREATPSFIQNVQQRMDFLNPSLDTRDSIPVLTVPRSIRIWKRVRWPLFIGIVVAILVVVGVVTSNVLTARNVERTIAEAQEAEAKGRVETFKAANHLLSKLAAKHPDRCNAQIAWAWQALAYKELLGAEGDDLVKKAERSLSRCEKASSAVAWAARVALLIERGQNRKALRICEQRAQKHPDEPRLAMVCAWATRGLGQIDEALADLQQAGQKFEDYTPLVVTANTIAFENDRLAESISFVQRLLTQSPQHFYGSLLTIALALPHWGDEPPSVEQVKTFVQDIGMLAASIEDAPPKYALLGRFLKGRIELLSGHLENAMETLGEVAEESKDPAHFAWYALAVLRSKGVEKALELLEHSEGMQGPLVWHLRADLLLEHHRVEEAEEYLKRIEEVEALQVAAARTFWVAAVRSGDLRGAEENMPDAFGQKDLFIALEIYEQLLERGDAKRIDDLVERMKPGLQDCAKSIDAWHRRNPRRALIHLGVHGNKKTGLCSAALAVMLLPGRAEPPLIKEFAERVEKAAGENLWIRIHVARALWRSEGLGAAVERLEKVKELEPQGGPLLSAMARTYISLGKPAEALEILGEPGTDQELAWAIDAAREAGKKRRLRRLLEEAAGRRDAGSEHPGLACELLTQKFLDNEFGEVSSQGEATYERGGRWAARIAELAALSYNYLGERREADILLERAYRKVTQESGSGISWDAKLAAARLNVRRGGKFMYKAQANAAELYNRGVKDPWISYTFGLANLRDGNDRIGVRFLKEALEIDPAFEPAYKRLSAMDKLGETLEEDVARVLAPGRDS